jgi:hypothetical protein
MQGKEREPYEILIPALRMLVQPPHDNYHHLEVSNAVWNTRTIKFSVQVG